MPFEQILYYLVGLAQVIFLPVMALQVVLLFSLHPLVYGISDVIGVEVRSFGLLHGFLSVFFCYHGLKTFGTLGDGSVLFVRTLSHWQSIIISRILFFIEQASTSKMKLLKSLKQDQDL